MTADLRNRLGGFIAFALPRALVVLLASLILLLFGTWPLSFKYNTSIYNLWREGIFPFHGPPSERLKEYEYPKVLNQYHEGSLGQSDISTLIEVLRNHRFENVRAEAAGALGSLGPVAKGALPALKDSLQNDDSVLVRRAADSAQEAIAAERITPGDVLHSLGIRSIRDFYRVAGLAVVIVTFTYMCVRLLMTEQDPIRTIRDLPLWILSGLTFWITAHLVTTMIPLRALWLPGPIALIAGALTGFSGYVLLDAGTSRRAIPTDKRAGPLPMLGLLGGAVLGWVYTPSSIALSTSVPLQLPASTADALTNAITCAILGYAANLGIPWSMRLYGKRPLVLLAVLVGALGLQFAVGIWMLL